MHLRDSLIRQYEKQGWMVYSDSFGEKAVIPGGWTGIYPDLIAVKGNRRIAVCIETDTTLRGEYAPARWKSILKNSNLSLEVVVRDKPASDLAVQIAERNGIDLSCRIMKRSEHRKMKKFGFGSLFRNRTSLFIMMITIVIVFIISFLFVPAMRKKAELQSDYYAPFDRERQVETLKKEINNIQKKK